MNQTREWLQNLYDENRVPEFAFSGKCHDCKQPVTVITIMDLDTGELSVTGGALWKIEEMEKPFFKCDSCFEEDPVLRNFQPCEVWSRIVGYLRPVKQWNKGKQEEFKDRTEFIIKKTEKE